MYYPVSWNTLHAHAFLLASRIKASGESFDCIVTIARGGLALSNMVADFLQLPVAAFTVKTYKAMQKASEPEVIFSVAPEIQGKKILLFDDIADTGDTLTFGVAYMHEKGALSVKTAALYLKPHSSIIPDYFARNVNEWVIFPFEIDETLAVYKQLVSTDPDKANDLWDNILKLELPAELVKK